MSAVPVSLVHANIISTLIARRDRLGLSQHHLAQLLGTTQKQIHLFESGKRSPSLMWLVRWTRVLGVKIRVVELVARPAAILNHRGQAIELRARAA